MIFARLFQLSQFWQEIDLSVFYTFTNGLLLVSNINVGPDLGSSLFASIMTTVYIFLMKKEKMDIYKNVADEN